ncbi:transglycosylase family protein [bacterium]|nr:transglycosylase family protein [bacterium]
MRKQAPKLQSRTARSRLAQPKRFKQPVLYTVLALCIIAGALLIYASFAGSIPVVGSNPDFWRPRIAGCEAGSGPTSTPNYKANNGAGHYGAYQYDVRTWRGAVGPELAAQYPLPSDAPPEVQDQAFYNTFARRGSQPWNASYYCWATPELKGTSRLPVLGPIGSLLPAATPTPTPAPNAYNIKVQGRVYIDDKLTPNVTLNTCVDGVTTKTDAGGIFRFELPAGKNYCVRVIDGLPTGAKIVKTNNNPERASEATYEHQLSDKNYYRNLWQFFTPYYTWDRASDEGFDFYYSVK